MPTLKEIVSIGLPAGIQGAVFSLANVVIQGAINSLGTEVIAPPVLTDSGDGSVQYLQLLYTGVHNLCRAELWCQTDGTLSQDFTLMPAGGCYLYRLLYAYRIYLRRQAYCAHQ